MTMSDTKKKFPIRQHKDLRTDPQYRQRKDKHIKVRKREIEKEEAEEAIRNYQDDEV